MNDLTKPQNYVPSGRPVIEGADMDFVMREFQKIQATLRDLCDLCPQEAKVAPTRVRDGMVRLARSPWRPAAGQTTDGWVYYDGGTWRLL